MTRVPLLLALITLSAAACDPAASVESDDTASLAYGDALAAHASQGLTRKNIPDEDPGPPFYARVTHLLNQFFHSDGWLAIPFHRDPECIPPDFNLLDLFDFPGATGPGAFGCQLHVKGFLLIEPDAPLGTFPRHVALHGDAMPFWFVPWTDAQAAMADGRLTIGEVMALGPLMGIAHRYHETLQPRDGEHRISIQAAGKLQDGRAFQFDLLHLGDQTRSIQIRFR